LNVGHDPLDVVDAVVGEGGGGAAEEPGAGVGFLVGVDLGVGDAGVVVDGGVDVVEPDPGPVAGPASFEVVAAVGPPAAPVAQSAEFLDIDVDEFAGAGAFVAADQRAKRRPWLSAVTISCCALRSADSQSSRSAMPLRSGRRGRVGRRWCRWQLGESLEKPSGGRDVAGSCSPAPEPAQAPTEPLHGERNHPYRQDRAAQPHGVLALERARLGGQARPRHHQEQHVAISDSVNELVPPAPARVRARVGPRLVPEVAQRPDELLDDAAVLPGVRDDDFIRSSGQAMPLPAPALVVVSPGRGS